MKTTLSRRSFLAASTLASTAFALRPKLFGAEAPSTAGTSKPVPIGLELYSVRNELSRDLPNALKNVAKAGYQVVEFYSPYFKWTPALRERSARAIGRSRPALLFHAQ